MAHPTMPRAELIEKIALIFRQHGYEGTSLARLSEATGLVKASLYYQFPRGKEDMAEAVLEASAAKMGDSVLASLKGPGPVRQRLALAMAALGRFYNDGRYACLIDVFGIGLSGDLFRSDLQRSVARLQAAFTGLLTEAGVPESDAILRGEDAVIAIQGALVVARATASNACFERVLAELPDRLLRGSTP